MLYHIAGGPRHERRAGVDRAELPEVHAHALPLPGEREGRVRSDVVRERRDLVPPGLEAQGVRGGD